MPFLRATIVDFGKKQAKDTATVTVRAGSKSGAMFAARVASTRIIPFREQEVINVRNLSNDRFFDKWEVQVRDVEQMAQLTN